MHSLCARAQWFVLRTCVCRPHVLGNPFTRASSSRPTDSLNGLLQQLFNTGAPNLYQFIDETVIRTAYGYCEHNQLRTARLLGISRNVVRDRLMRYGLLESQKAPNGTETAIRNFCSQRHVR